MNNGQSRYVLGNAEVATQQDTGQPYGLVSEGAVVIDGGIIRWVGAQAELPREYGGWPHTNVAGALITPALIDCHTHLVFAGDRTAEFELRLQGASYEDIAKAGGGIFSTVAATRQASESDLLAATLYRVDDLLAEGVACIEIKSGYGLDIENELKILRVAREIESHRRVRVMTSFLAAHAVPPEYKGRADAYVDEVCLPALRLAHQDDLVDAVDGYCEKLTFNRDQIARVFDEATGLGLPIKLHAEQLSNSGGAALAASYGAVSADHLEYLDDAGIQALAAAGTVAVLLPGAWYFLRERQLPPIDALRNTGIPIAVSTDCNPGTSPMSSILTAMNMACVCFGLTPEEALRGATRNAAKALGLDDCGVLASGMRADLAVWDLSHPAQLSGTMGVNRLQQRIFGGVAC